jgi:hypothetical protein
MYHPYITKINASQRYDRLLKEAEDHRSANKTRNRKWKNALSALWKQLSTGKGISVQKSADSLT